MTTRQEISNWFDAGVQRGAKHMLVICDTYDHEDYPVYTQTDEECLERYKTPGSMQRVMEVYDLALDRDVQLDTTRVCNLPGLPASADARG